MGFSDSVGTCRLGLNNIQADTALRDSRGQWVCSVIYHPASEWCRITSLSERWCDMCDVTYFFFLLRTQRSLSEPSSVSSRQLLFCFTHPPRPLSQTLNLTRMLFNWLILRICCFCGQGGGGTRIPNQGLVGGVRPKAEKKIVTSLIFGGSGH